MRCPNVLCVAFASTLLLAVSACASSHPARNTAAEEARIILLFNAAAPAPDDTNLTTMLAEACNCTPRFIRRYLDNALIYQVTLTADQTFNAFSQSLLAKGHPSGLRSVELDTLQHR